MEHGEALGHGKVVGGARAFAQGSLAYNGMSAYVSPPMRVPVGPIGGSQGLIGPSSSTSTSTSDSLNEAAEKLSEATEEASDVAEEAGSALDGFKEWLGKLFDWIEVKLNSQEKKLDKIVSDAERALDNKNYDKAILKYNQAIEESTKLITTSTQSASKYRALAEQVLDKAIEAGAIDSNMAAEIKFKVEAGDMNIDEYSDDIREVISAYQQWAEKVEQTEDKISDLQDKLNDYVDSLKEVADTQRDVAVSNADMYSDIGGGTYAFSGGAKYNQLRASDENIRLTNNAYAKNVSDVYNAMKTVRGGAINSIKANQDTNASYNEALGEARKNMNSGRKISDSVIQEVAKRNPSMAAQLQAYNRAWDNYQTANLEYVTKVTENSALKQQNTADKFDAIDSQLENEIKNLEQQNEDGDLAASEKNHNLDRIAQRQTKIASNATARADAYRREESTYKTQITQTKSAKGANYNGLTMKAKTNVNNVCQEAMNAAKSGGRIKDTTLTKLAQFVGSGLVTAAFYESCVNYNNAYEHRLEAEQAAEIAQVTRKKQAEEIALQKISNISEEAEKQRKSITISNNEKRRQLSARKAMGEDVEEEETQLELNEQRQIYKNRKDEERHIMQQMEGMDENSDTYRQAAERLDEVREGASEAGNKIVELSGKMADLKLSGFDKAIEKLDKLKSKIQSVIDVNEAKGNYTDKTKLGQLAQIERDQAEQSRQKARKYESNANLAKKNGGTWAGHTTDYWEEQATTARTDQNQHNAAAYNYDKQIRELPFEKWNDFTDIIDSTITGLDNKAELAELKGTLVDVSVLEEKRAQLLEKQNTQNKKIAELQKLVNDPSIGKKARNEYKKQLQEEQNALDATNQSLIQTNQSLTNLSLDKLNKAVELFNIIADNALQTIETIKAEGHYATEEDYQPAVEMQQQAVDYKKQARDEAYDNWQNAKNDPSHEYGGFTEAQLFETYMQLDTEWKKARQTLATTTKQMSEVWQDEFGAKKNLAHEDTEKWEQHLQTKEADGQYITTDDIETTIGLVFRELDIQLAEHARLQELYDQAIADGREADADAYQQLLGENEEGTESLQQKIFNLRDQITQKELDACDEIINYWTKWIEQYKSTLDADESNWTSEQKQNIENATTKIVEASEKGAQVTQDASERAKKEGRYKASNDWALKSMDYATSANRSRRSISELWEVKNDSSDSEEEDTLADKLQRELNILDAEYNILKSKQELLQAQGEEIDTQGYQKRVDQLMANIKKNEELVHANMQLANQSGGDDKKAKEYLQNAKQAEAEIYNLQVEMQNLGDEMRKTWLTKDLDEFIDKIGVLSDAIETITGLISDEMMYNEGKITDYGLTSLAMMIKGYEVNNKELATLLEKRAAYIKEYNEGQNPYYSKKEFIEDYKAITSEIQKATSTSYQMINKIVDATIKMREEEVKQIQSVIDKRKQLLQQQKDQWNWDRTLKQKSNDLSILEKQKKALDGLTDAESRARLQKINKQIADAREDLQNTVKDHNIELQVSGLDALKESLSKSLEEFSKRAQSDIENLMATVDDATELVTSSMARVENNITSLLNVPGLEGLDEVSVGLRPYLIPDYTGAQTYIMSNGTILDSISGGGNSGVAGLSDAISNTTSNVKYLVPDLNAQMAPIPTTSNHEINIHEIVNNYTINDATDPDKVWEVIKNNARPIANAISEEIMHNVSYKGIKKTWN